jgi:hypothetical protein
MMGGPMVDLCWVIARDLRRRCEVPKVLAYRDLRPGPVVPGYDGTGAG